MCPPLLRSVSSRVANPNDARKNRVRTAIVAGVNHAKPVVAVANAARPRTGEAGAVRQIQNAQNPVRSYRRCPFRRVKVAAPEIGRRKPTFASESHLCTHAAKSTAPRDIPIDVTRRQTSDSCAPTNRDPTGPARIPDIERTLEFTAMTCPNAVHRRKCVIRFGTIHRNLPISFCVFQTSADERQHYEAGPALHTCEASLSSNNVLDVLVAREICFSH